MADWYVDSNATGSPTDGLTWDTAFHSLTEADAVDASGDNIWVASDHSESTSTSFSVTFSGSVGSPTRIISADKTSGEPPATIKPGATVTTTGASTLSASTAYGYWFGITFNCGTGASAAHMQLGSGNNRAQWWDSCTFNIVNTASTSLIRLVQTGNAEGYSNCKNCMFSFAHVSQSISVGQGDATVFITGGGLAVSSSAITTCFVWENNTSRLSVSGFDFSSGDATMNLGSVAENGVLAEFRNCKLPSSWSGSLNGTSMAEGSDFIGTNNSSSDINYALRVEQSYGVVSHETALVKSGGASDGTTSISWDMTTNANAEWSHQTLDSPEIVRWNETVGGSITITVDILHDGAQGGSPSEPLTDQDIWLEVQYLGTGGFPLSLFEDDASSTYVSTALVQPLSAASWTTTGMSNPIAQKLSVNVVPQEKGFFHAKVRLAKASYTVYIDPLLQLS